MIYLRAQLFELQEMLDRLSCFIFASLSNKREKKIKKQAHRRVTVKPSVSHITPND